MSDSLVLYLLGAIDIALFAALILGYSTIRKRKPLRITDLRQAFDFLEKRLQQAFPDMREGFTWIEAMSRVKTLCNREDWKEVDEVLQKYQAYRYGGVEPGEVQVDSVVKLAMTLPRRQKK